LIALSVPTVNGCFSACVLKIKKLIAELEKRGLETQMRIDLSDAAMMFIPCEGR
jgi:hypothetical protein